MPIATLTMLFSPRACTRTVEREAPLIEVEPHPVGVPAGLPDAPDLPGWLLPDELPSVAWLGGSGPRWRRTTTRTVWTRKASTGRR